MTSGREDEQHLLNTTFIEFLARMITKQLQLLDSKL